MMTFSDLASVPRDPLAPFTDQLRLAVAAYLARFKGSSRAYTESDLRCYLTWCAERGLDPMTARRPHLELYIRWMQEIRRFKPSAVSRRFSAGFYRTCVVDGVLEHSPAGPGARADPAQQPRHSDGPARGHPPPAPPRRNRRHPDRQGTPAHAPPHVRHDHARRWR